MSCFEDLSPHGVIPLTGEACGLSYRILCDVTAKGKKLLEKALGLRDLGPAENWNRGSETEPHIGSVMLTTELITFLGVFALLEAGCKEVWTFKGRGVVGFEPNDDPQQVYYFKTVREKERSVDRWIPPNDFGTRPVATDRLLLTLGNDGAFEMNDWSFGQLCKFAGITKETVNRLTSDTAARVFGDTLPGGTKPLQIFTEGERVRSIHRTSYTRLHNADPVTMLREFATDFEPPQKGMNGGTGLYCGEQDMFVFMIDPTGWAEINGEAFAPGFFLWNSEVGKRSLGVQTFWWQAVCQNHIVWDAVEIVDFSRKHTGNVHESVMDIRRIIESLVKRRDERKDGFVKLIAKAMETKLGTDAEEVMVVLSKSGITRSKRRRRRGVLTARCNVSQHDELPRDVPFSISFYECDCDSPASLDQALRKDGHSSNTRQTAWPRTSWDCVQNIRLNVRRI